MSQRNLLPLLSCTMIEAAGSSDDMFMYIYCVALCHIPGCSHQFCCLINKSFLLRFRNVNVLFIITGTCV